MAPSPLHQQSFANWAGGTYPQAGDSQPVLGPSPVFRDVKDRQLAAFGASPDTIFPDGYIGTQPATSRRSDRLLDATFSQNHRNYSRGVHKGERINVGDYFWPKEFHPMIGLEYEAQGLKWTPQGGIPARLTNDGKVGPDETPTALGRPILETIDPQRRSMLRHLAPPWR